MNIFSTGKKYQTCLVGISDVSGIHSFCRIAPNLLLSISIFKPNCRYLLEMTRYTENLHKNWSNTNIKWNLNWDTIFVLLKFGLVRVLLSVEGVVGDLAKVSPRGYHEDYSSQSLFQFLFLIPLVDSEATELTVTNFLKHTTISRVLSGDA